MYKSPIYKERNCRLRANQPIAEYYLTHIVIRSLWLSFCEYWLFVKYTTASRQAT